MNKGEVWIVECDPSVGEEFRKERRAVIVSEDWAHSQKLRIAVPLTGWKDHLARWPWMVRLMPSPGNGITKIVAANALQVKCFSTERFVQKVGVLSEQDLVDVMAAVAMVMGLQTPDV